MTHPNSLDLEAFACGETSARIAGHVAECGECAAFVAQLGGLVTAGPSAEEAEQAVARAMARNVSASEPKASPANANANASTYTNTNGTRRLWLIATSVVTPLAAAAAILLLVRSTPAPSPNGAARPGAPAEPAMNVQLGSLPPRAEPDTQFKGGAQIAVIRERGKEQARFSSTVRVRPGDRLRVEVALDREQAILGGVLADDGSYLELMTEGVRGPGTHFSERSAKIDSLPTRGTIVVGSPDAVARARETKVLEGVGTLRVEWELSR